MASLATPPAPVKSALPGFVCVLALKRGGTEESVPLGTEEEADRIGKLCLLDGGVAGYAVEDRR